MDGSKQLAESGHLESMPRDDEDEHYDSYNRQRSHMNHSSKNEGNKRMGESTSKIDYLKQNLNMLESKVKELRDTRQQQKSEVIEKQKS